MNSLTKCLSLHPRVKMVGSELPRRLENNIDGWPVILVMSCSRMSNWVLAHFNILFSGSQRGKPLAV